MDWGCLCVQNFHGNKQTEIFSSQVQCRVFPNGQILGVLIHSSPLPSNRRCAGRPNLMVQSDKNLCTPQSAQTPPSSHSIVRHPTPPPSVCGHPYHGVWLLLSTANTEHRRGVATTQLCQHTALEEESLRGWSQEQCQETGHVIMRLAG